MEGVVHVRLNVYHEAHGATVGFLYSYVHVCISRGRRWPETCPSQKAKIPLRLGITMTLIFDKAFLGTDYK